MCALAIFNLLLRFGYCQATVALLTGAKEQAAMLSALFSSIVGDSAAILVKILKKNRS